MPCVASVEALLQAAAGFEVADLDLVIEPAAQAAAARSLEESGLLLVGEAHGVWETPLLLRALLQAFGLTSLALEWHEDLAPVIAAFLATGTLADHGLLWSGDGRITAGHLAVLAERAAAGPLEVILFDGSMAAGWSWSQRDEAMARRILAGSPAGTRTLAVAGNAHTPTSRISLGVPMGAVLARRRPGIREIRINYGGGHFYCQRSRRFGPVSPQPRQLRLYQQRGALVLHQPSAREAVVPQRSGPGRPPPGGGHRDR